MLPVSLCTYFLEDCGGSLQSYACKRKLNSLFLLQSRTIE